jgi:hypothetical protein
MPVMVQAWEVIDQFNTKFFGWWTLNFPHLKVDDLEECNHEWNRKLDFIEKDKNFMSHETSATFVEYIKL